MNIHKRIEHAVRNAPLAERFVESTNDLSSFTDKEDDYTIHLNEKALPDLPNEVTLDIEHRSGLEQLLEAYRDITDTTLSREYIEYAQRHESQHFRAAKYLGAISARVGVRIYNVRPSGHESQLTVQPFLRVRDFKTTKLGAALVSAYPIPPSNGDEMDIKAYGYSGVDELADKAMSRNRSRKNQESDQFYPVPLGSGSIPHRRSFFINQMPEIHSLRNYQS